MTDTPELPELHQRALAHFQSLHDHIPEKVEQIARALARMQTPNTQEIEDRNWQHRIADAIVAIEALREPNKQIVQEMMEEHIQHSSPDYPQYFEHLYRAAIDAALK